MVQATAKQRSAFEDWFVEQHGTRGCLFISRSDAELGRMIDDGEAARQELDLRRNWDRRHESALYAWQARERV